jgi:F-type H+-transporting ATPase subunit alpha
MQQINRGQRLEELLKQAQYEPVPVELQIAVIYAGTSGALDEVPVALVGEFERTYCEHLKSNHPELLQTLRTEKKWTDEVKAQFDEVGQGFVKEFLA